MSCLQSIIIIAVSKTGRLSPKDVTLCGGAAATDRHSQPEHRIFTGLVAGCQVVFRRKRISCFACKAGVESTFSPTPQQSVRNDEHNLPPAGRLSALKSIDRPAWAYEALRADSLRSSISKKPTLPGRKVAQSWTEVKSQTQGQDMKQPQNIRMSR